MITMGESFRVLIKLHPKSLASYTVRYNMKKISSTKKLNQVRERVIFGARGPGFNPSTFECLFSL